MIGVFKINIFVYFSLQAPSPFGALKGGLKICQKFFQGEFLEFQKNGHPFLGPPQDSPKRIVAMSFSTTPVDEKPPWAFQKRPEGLPRITTTPKYGVHKGLQAQNYRALLSRRKNTKKTKNEDSCRRLVTSWFSGYARNSLSQRKSDNFTWEG